MNTMRLAFRLALREMRGGLRGFRIFLACLALGVAAIAGAASLNESVKTGIAENARPLLGGDLQARLTNAPAADAEVAALRQAGDVSSQVQMRSMAHTEDGAGNAVARSLIELKAVDNSFPLYGDIALDPTMPLSEALAVKDGLWGAAIDPSLLTRLKIKLGDTIKVGEEAVVVRALIAKEPDRLVTPTVSGPRVLIATAALPATQLVQTGSLVSFVYNVRLTHTETAEQMRTRLGRAFPDAGWRLRGLHQAAEGIEVFLDNVTLFLTLIGLTALLTGGMGVANAVGAYLHGRRTTIAILKCLGASADLIFAVYLVQVGLLALVGIGLGVVLGAAVAPVAIYFIGDLLPVTAKAGVYPQALLQAAVFGVFISGAFALWPLAQARDTPPTTLFRNLSVTGQSWPRKRYLAALAILAAGLAAYTAATAEQPRFVMYFAVGVIVALILFRVAASLVMTMARRLSTARQGPAAGRPSLRLALANLYRPGAPTTSVVLSLGLGLSVLVAVALLQNNLETQIRNGLPSDAPSIFFIDIQPSQVDAFTALTRAQPGVHKVTAASMIRGRISKIKGVPVEQADVDPDSRWAVRGERGLSQSATAPENARVAKGAWWPADENTENLVSLDAAVAKGMHLDVGDTISVDILGHEITARIANLRDIRWQSGAMNFTLIFSPNALAGAPSSYIATVNSDKGTEDKIEQVVLDTMPNVTVIQVREALDLLRGMLSNLAVAVRITASVALATGALVLAGVIAAGHSRRIYEAVVLKVLGATRGDVLRAFIFEFSLLGLATGLIAALVGALAAWAVVRNLMNIPWTLNGTLVAEVIAACILVTLAAGFSGTWRALGSKAAPLLRDE
ncbi:MAG: FtsX-like permease family protein [Rhodospirillaceae bacterium]|nr:MAG: FtsX-like permease family protein [Rhodospirillaceae bacterium]